MGFLFQLEMVIKIINTSSLSCPASHSRRGRRRRVKLAAVQLVERDNLIDLRRKRHFLSTNLINLTAEIWLILLTGCGGHWLDSRELHSKESRIPRRLYKRWATRERFWTKRGRKFIFCPKVGHAKLHLVYIPVLWTLMAKKKKMRRDSYITNGWHNNRNIVNCAFLQQLFCVSLTVDLSSAHGSFYRQLIFISFSLPLCLTLYLVKLAESSNECRHYINALEDSSYIISPHPQAACSSKSIKSTEERRSRPCGSFCQIDSKDHEQERQSEEEIYLIALEEKCI